MSWSTKKGSSARRVDCVCLNCGKNFFKYKSEIAIGQGKYCSIGCRSSNPEYITRLKKSIEKIKEVRRKKWSGAGNPNWRGGVAGQRALAMSKSEYKEWRKEVYERDGYKCVICSTPGTGRNLNADHIKPWLTHESLRYTVSNGRTLCVDCHRKTDTYGWRVYNREVKWAK